MTALDKYVRLEAVGLWREGPDAPPREVVVSFGKTTLLLTDIGERPLGHWALAGVSVLGRDESGATVYAMSAGETLAIRDRDMVAAIAAVRRQLPEPRRKRRRVGPILAVVALVVVAAMGPPLLRETTVRLIPPEQAAELGDRMLISLLEQHGPPCDGPEGQRALAKLATALAPEDTPRVRVMELGDTPVAVLPGVTVLLDRGTVAQASPEEIAGWTARAAEDGPVGALVGDAGLFADIRYILSGRFDDRTLARAAESAVARHLPAALVGVDEMTDSDWEAVRGICQ